MICRRSCRQLVPSPTPEAAAVGFAATLRKSGHDVSLTSSMLFAEALSAVGVGNPAGVYWAARATLVHRPEDIPTFNGVFVAYWGGIPSGLVWRPPQEEISITMETDDPEAAGAEPDQAQDDGDTITITYSSTEILRQKDFAAYSDDELEESRRLMEQMRFNGPTRSSRRRRPANRGTGRPDMRRTVRLALKAGGEPMSLARTRRGEKPRRIVLLLDISGSMENYARALIRFLHATVAGRSRVEAFALGTRLTRLTRELSSRDPDRALDAAANAVADWSGGTRLGDGLKSFNDEWGCRGMARGAVVVILSDGWDRGEPGQMDEQMGRLHRVAHRVIWVNPLKASPGYQPLARGMAAALPHVDDFLEGHSIESLEVLASLLITTTTPRARLVHS